MKTQRMLVPPGRLDVLAQGMFEEALKRHGNPALRIAARMASSHIAQALSETLGPDTKPGMLAADIVKAADEFYKRYMEAKQQIEAEDRG